MLANQHFSTLSPTRLHQLKTSLSAPLIPMKQECQFQMHDMTSFVNTTNRPGRSFLEYSLADQNYGGPKLEFLKKSHCFLTISGEGFSILLYKILPEPATSVIQWRIKFHLVLSHIYNKNSIEILVLR